jgi:hypothetical protein
MSYRADTGTIWFFTDIEHFFCDSGGGSETGAMLTDGSLKNYTQADLNSLKFG